MRKTQILTAVLSLLVINIISAQEDKKEDNRFLQAGDAQNIEVLAPTNSFYAFDNSDNTIEGTVYIQKNYMPAKLTLNDVTKIYNIRYNAYSDEFEIENEGKQPGALNKKINNLLIVFVDDNKTYESLYYVNDDGNTLKGYFVHVGNPNSKHRLLVKESITFVEKKPAETSYDKSQPAKFKRLKDSYYIASNNNPAIEFPKKKKDFAKVFPEKHKEILGFIKKNKIKTSKESDIKQLMTFINSL